MKKIIITLALLFAGLASFANTAEKIILTGEVAFDWLSISQIQRETKIKYYKDIIFDENDVFKYPRKEFKEKYAIEFRDENYVEHYDLVKKGIEEDENARYCGFYWKRVLVSYAIQYKKDPRTVYYYDTYGHLKFVDMLSDNYPNFPYWSKQYQANGKMKSAIYFVSHDMQYMYEPQGKFKGVWYKDTMYDSHAKEVMTRTNW